MAKEWAAKDRGPRGATIIVVTICAPLIAILSTAIGEPILRTLLIQNISGRKEPGWPTRAILSDFTTRNQSSRHVLTNSARIVPKAAPATPRSAPGTVMLSPRIL